MPEPLFAKAVYNMPTIEYLLDRLESDIKLRRICGWQRKSDVPSSSTFSRALAEFAKSLPDWKSRVAASHWRRWLKISPVPAVSERKNSKRYKTS